MNWQRRHEQLIRMMATLVGAKAKDNTSINEALARQTDPAIHAEFDQLNRLNDEAVDNWLHRRNFAI